MSKIECWYPFACDDKNLTFSFEKRMHQLHRERESLLMKIAPAQKRPVVCVHWLRGLCRSDDITCDSLHVYDPALFPVCHFFNKEEGRCNNPDCIFRHPSTIDDDVLCIAYAKGFCEQGEKCPHRHVKHTASELSRREHYIARAEESHKQMKEQAKKYQFNQQAKTNTIVQKRQQRKRAYTTHQQEQKAKNKRQTRRRR